MLSASQLARKALAKKYPEELKQIYESLLVEAKVDGPTIFPDDYDRYRIRQKAKGKAITALTHNHINEYYDLRVKALNEGHPTAWHSTERGSRKVTN